MIVGSFLSPKRLRIPIGSPSQWISISREHEITRYGDIGIRIGNMRISTVVEIGSIFPASAQEVVIIRCGDRVGLCRMRTSTCIDVIQETAHSVAFVIDDPISVANSVQRFSIANPKGIVNGIIVLVRSFKKVDPHGWRTCSVTFETNVIGIHCISVVQITQTAIDITACKIIEWITQCTVNKDPEIGVEQGLRPAVDQFVIVEGHVVDVIIGSEGKRLRTNFHSNWVTSSFGMDIPFVIHDPPQIEITV